MPRARLIVSLVVVLVAACGPAPSPSVAAPTALATPLVTVPASPAPTVSTSVPSAASSASATAAAGRELTTGSVLPAGTYTRARFRPPISLTLDDGWMAGTLTDGFFDVQQQPRTPDVIAVQFARVDGIVSAGASSLAPTTAAAAAKAIHQNPGVVVIDEGPARIGGLDGFSVTVENRGTANARVMRVSAGTLGIDPMRRLQVSLFDAADGLLAVMVGGSVATWDHALAIAKPVLESVAVGR